MLVNNDHAKKVKFLPHHSRCLLKCRIPELSKLNLFVQRKCYSLEREHRIARGTLRLGGPRRGLHCSQPTEILTNRHSREHIVFEKYAIYSDLPRLQRLDRIQYIFPYHLLGMNKFPLSNGLVSNKDRLRASPTL